MAEFCQQCADALGLENDFLGCCERGMCVSVICEGCGPTVVDHAGNCIAADCIVAHGGTVPTSHPSQPEDR